MPKFTTDPTELKAEIRSIPVTLEPLISPREGQLSPDDQALVSRLFFETQDGTARAIRTLKRLVAKYPNVPSLKNHLTVAYTAAGLDRQADKVNDQLRRENPDYLFGILNYASGFIEQGSDFGKIPEILGETLRLVDLKPDIELFHYTEVKGFYNLVAHFHLLDGRPKLAKAIYDILVEIDGSDDRQLELLRRSIAFANWKSVQKRMDDDDARAVLVTLPPIPVASGPDPGPPDFHHPEIGALYRHGFDLPPAVVAEILALPRETLIADLEAVLRDSLARAPHFFADEDDDDDSDTYFPVHALFLIGELKAEESLPVVLEVLSQHPDILDMWFGDYLDIHLWESIYHLAEGQLELGRRFLVSPDISGRAREIFSEVVAQVAFHQPGRRGEVVDWFRELLEFFLDSPPEDNVLDSYLVSGLIWIVSELRADELLPLIRAHYEKGYIALAQVGDLEEITASIADPHDEKRVRELKGMAKRYREIVTPRPAAPGAFPRTHGTGIQDDIEDDLGGFGQKAVPRSPQVGRNDPCPCGSGKKYKKCCLGKPVPHLNL